MATASATIDEGNPSYETATRSMQDSRSTRAEDFAELLLSVVRQSLSQSPVSEWDILDVGCGYGGTTLALARHVRTAVGIDPGMRLISEAQQDALRRNQTNVQFHVGEISTWTDTRQFDLIVLDNVFEHLPDQPGALRAVERLLKPEGVCYLVTPNKLWPVEVHYRLPFLSYLPLPLANQYLRLTGRGRDYRDCSYASTIWKLKRLLNSLERVNYRFTVPDKIELATQGKTARYRYGARLLKACPWLWCLSKAFVVVIQKEAA